MKNQELLTERVVKKFQFNKIRRRLKCETKGNCGQMECKLLIKHGAVQNRFRMNSEFGLKIMANVNECVSLSKNRRQDTHHKFTVQCAAT